jgi:formylglycine-generating enzyme required for sulfatase activity
MAQRYTQVARPTLWLVPEATCSVGGEGPEALPAFDAEVGPLYVSKSAITNAQYEAFDPGHERSASSAGDDDPAVSVSFHDAVAYCDWYSELSKKAFRLPTEVEWEHVCRGGGPSRGALDADACAWHAGNSEGRCHEVETLRANGWGVHDMLGNVWEWTSSRFLPYPARAGDGRDDLDAVGQRVLRGSSFRTPSTELSCGERRAADPTLRADDIGFRIVRELARES